MSNKIPFSAKYGVSITSGGLVILKGLLKSTPSSSDSGTVEYDGNNLYLITDSGTRNTLAYGDGSYHVNNQTSAYSLIASDAGKLIVTSGGNVTVNGGIFSAGDVILVYNNSATTMTITQGSSVTLYRSGYTTTGTTTLYARSVANVMCIDTNNFSISSIGIVS